MEEKMKRKSLREREREKTRQKKKKKKKKRGKCEQIERQIDAIKPAAPFVIRFRAG